jgi:hypothetical protein
LHLRHHVAGHWGGVEMGGSSRTALGCAAWRIQVPVACCSPLFMGSPSAQVVIGSRSLTDCFNMSTEERPPVIWARPWGFGFRGSALSATQ